VSLFYRIGWFLFVNPALPARSVSELVAHAKANPGKLNYGYASPQPLLLSEAFIKRAGIDVVKVSYKGDAAISQALVAGEVQIALATLSSYRGLVDGGKVRVLATTGQARSPIFPDVPTLQELGFNNFIISAGNGFWVPSGTPAPIITRLSRELASVAAQADTKEVFRNASSAETVGSTPEEFAANTTREQAFYAEAAKAANYQPEQ
jgi:tripartite-type tricarboxylate transporter receptor subunit TctC